MWHEPTIRWLRQTPSVEFPEEFQAYLEFLEVAEPESYALFHRAADIGIS